MVVVAGKHAESELLEVTERINGLSAQNSALTSARRKLETDNDQLRSELEEALAEAKNADERAKKATTDVSLIKFMLQNLSKKSAKSVEEALLFDYALQKSSL